MEKETKNVLNTLLDAGYSSCEICFNIKLKRKGLLKWLENKNIIKPKKEGFALIIRELDDIIVLSSNTGENSVINITSTKINGLH